MKTNTAKRLQSKRVWLGLCIALAVLLAGGVGIAAKQDHEQRMAAVAAQQAALRKQADVAISASESLSRTERLNAISGMANVTILTTDKCKGDWWSSWYASAMADADIITAWAALNRASEKEDKAAYFSAKASLEDAYAAVSKLTDVSDEKVLEFASHLKAAAQKL